MHALISAALALALQTPGLSVSPIDAAMLAQRAAVAPGHAPHFAIRLSAFRDCPCPARSRRA